MIKAKHHPVIYPLFQRLTTFLIKRHFNAVYIEGEFADKGQSVLVVANHVSWWDGFWVEYLNLKKIGKKFYFMMLKEQLKKHWYFKHTGGYSVKKKSREALESITYTSELLSQPGNLVLLFPQGEIHSIYNNDFHFEKGIARVLKLTPPETTVLFVANLVDYFSDIKPNLSIYQEAFTVKDFEFNSIEDAYNHFYLKALCTQKEKTS